ncbi:MAG: lipopolysaccharide assembly protein LapA domain-containing protein [Candidatus Deferrimicrobiaceae bacterium]
MRLVLVLLVIVMGLFAAFAIQNTKDVEVNFLNYYVKTNILLVIVTAFGAGVVVGFLPGIPASFRRRRRIRELESEMATLRKAQPPPPPVTP